MYSVEDLFSLALAAAQLCLYVAQRIQLATVLTLICSQRLSSVLVPGQTLTRLQRENELKYKLDKILNWLKHSSDCHLGYSSVAPSASRPPSSLATFLHTRGAVVAPPNQPSSQGEVAGNCCIYKATHDRVNTQSYKLILFFY